MEHHVRALQFGIIDAICMLAQVSIFETILYTFYRVVLYFFLLYVYERPSSFSNGISWVITSLMCMLTLNLRNIAAAKTTASQPPKTTTITSTRTRQNVNVTAKPLESTEVNGAAQPILSIWLATSMTLASLLMFIF